jgi:hypothetical protein
MKDFIKKVLRFLLMVPLVWAAGILIYGKIAPGFLQKNVRVTFYRNFNSVSLKEIDTMAHVDILIAGPSSAFRSFDPAVFEKFNLKIFILGSSAQSPVQTKYLVDKYLDKLHPRLFIYVANMQAISSDGTEGWLFLANNLEHYDSKFLKSAISGKSYYVANALCYNIISSAISKPKPFTSKLEHYVADGYVAYNAPAHDTIFYGASYFNTTCHIPEKQKIAFGNTIKSLEERKIPVVILQTPVYDRLFSSFSNRAEIDNYFASFPGIHYANFNYCNFTKSMFWDAMHLNSDGVLKFDTMLIDSLKLWNCLPESR